MLTVVVVANRKQSIDAGDYGGHSVQTEYFSDEELEQIVGAMRSFGVYVRSYFSEDEFIAAVLSGEYESLPREYKLVYNSAQSGIGPGRKALIPAFCRLHDIPITGSDAYVVSLARHKYHTSCILASAGIPTARTWCYLPGSGWLGRNRPPDGTRVLLKLTYESASIGLTADALRDVDGWLDAAAEAMAQQYEQPLTVQEFISGHEVETPVIGFATPFAPAAIGISKDGRNDLGESFLTYDDVYADRYGFYTYDDPEIAQRVRAAAVAAFEAVGVRGFGRVDFRIDDRGQIYAFDMSTNPHIICHSSYAFLFQASGRRYEDVAGLLLALGCLRKGWLRL